MMQYSLVGAVVVTLFFAPAGHGDSIWIVYDNAATVTIHTLPEEGVNARQYDPVALYHRNHCHLFWIVYQEGRGRSLHHALWPTISEGASRRVHKSVLAEEQSSRYLTYGVTASSDGLAVASQHGLQGLLIVRRWDASKTMWTEALSGPELDRPAAAAGQPWYFVDRGTLFWCCYHPGPILIEPKPLEAQNSSATTQPTQLESLPASAEIMAQVHRYLTRLHVAELGNEIPPQWRSLPDALDGTDGAPSLCKQVVFECSEEEYAIFAESSSPENSAAALRYYRYNPEEPPVMIGEWVLPSGTLSWKVFPVPGSSMYYLIWRGADDPETGLHNLYWSRSDRPGEHQILVADRDPRCGPPVGVFRAGALDIEGIVCWKGPSHEVVVSRLVGDAWLCPVSLSLESTEDMAVALTGDESGVFFVTSGRELRGVPFTMRAK